MARTKDTGVRRIQKQKQAQPRERTMLHAGEPQLLRVQGPLCLFGMLAEADRGSGFGALNSVRRPSPPRLPARAALASAAAAPRSRTMSSTHSSQASTSPGGCVFQRVASVCVCAIEREREREIKSVCVGVWVCQAKRLKEREEKKEEAETRVRAERQQAAYLRNGGHRRVAAFGMLGDVAKVAAKRGATRVAHRRRRVLVIPLEVVPAAVYFGNCWHHRQTAPIDRAVPPSGKEARKK